MVFSKIKGVHLNGHKEMSTNKPIQDFLSPESVFLPLVVGNLVYEKVVEIGDKVLKGQTVLERRDRFGYPVASPVSGTVKGTKKMWHSSGKMLEMLEITNDYEEKTVSSYGVPVEGELTKEKIVERVKNAGIVGLGGAGFPTYVKYTGNAKIETVLINAAECEPYITADYMLIKSECDKLLRGITYIMKATGAQNAKIAIKKTKHEAIEVLRKHISDYPNVEVFLMKDVYPAGWEKYIVENAIGKTYNGLPSEVGVVVNNVQTAIAVCEAVEENKPLIEKVVTITGEGIQEPQNLRVKIGTNVATMIAACGSYTENLGEAWLIAGGPMTGRTVMGDNLVVSANLGSVIVKPKQLHVDNHDCMGCGKCATHCPAHLTPTEIRLAFDQGDVDALKELNTMKCVQCGLCSYVCPSRVEMTEIVGKAKDYVAKMSRR